MPPSPRAYLVHLPGPDRAAIADRLRSAGYVVVERDDAHAAESELFPDPPELVAARSDALRSAGPAAVSALRRAGAVLIAGDGDPLHGFARVVREPFFIDELLPGRGPAAPPAAANDDDWGAILRGVAHALSNRVQVAGGWSSLLELSGISSERRAEALTRLRAEISLIGRCAQALATVGGRPSTGLAGDVACDVAGAVVAEAESRGVAVRTRGPGSVYGIDGEEIAVVTALLLSDHEDAGSEIAIVGGPHAVEISFPAGAEDLLPFPNETTADALRRVKRASTLGALAATRLAARAGGTFRCEREAGGARWIMSLPSVERRRAEGGR
jgi:hypothetical protein